MKEYSIKIQENIGVNNLANISVFEGDVHIMGATAADKEAAIFQLKSRLNRAIEEAKKAEKILEVLREQGLD